jgi:hypothetical protein
MLPGLSSILRSVFARTLADLTYREFPSAKMFSLFLLQSDEYEFPRFARGQCLSAHTDTLLARVYFLQQGSFMSWIRKTLQPSICPTPIPCLGKAGEALLPHRVGCRIDESGFQQGATAQIRKKLIPSLMQEK